MATDKTEKRMGQRMTPDKRIEQLEAALGGIRVATLVYLPDGVLLPASVIGAPATVAGLSALRAACMNLLAQLDGALVAAVRAEKTTDERQSKQTRSADKNDYRAGTRE